MNWKYFTPSFFLPADVCMKQEKSMPSALPLMQITHFPLNLTICFSIICYVMTQHIYPTAAPAACLCSKTFLLLLNTSPQMCQPVHIPWIIVLRHTTYSLIRSLPYPVTRFAMHTLHLPEWKHLEAGLGVNKNVRQTLFLHPSQNYCKIPWFIL